MRLGAALIALLLLAGCASPAALDKAPLAATISPVRAVEALPKDLGSLRRVGEVTDFERRPGGAGLGASVRYASTTGERVNVTVYIYDRGRLRAPDGGDGPDARQEMRTAQAELELAVRTGLYRSTKFETGMEMRTRGGPVEMRCANFRIVQRDGAPTGDSVCIAVQGGRFVKLRLTVWEPADPTFAGAMAAALMSQALEARAGATAAGDGLPPHLPRT